MVDEVLNERLALEQLYASTNGPQWRLQAGWRISGGADDVCAWAGISCVDGRVVYVPRARYTASATPVAQRELIWSRKR